MLDADDDTYVGVPALALCKRIFRRVPKGVIQVGAHNGRELKRFARAGIAKGLFIDPLDSTFPVLEQRAAEVEGYRAVQALIGAADGETVLFRVASNTGESSSMQEPAAHTRIRPDITFEDPVEMTVRTLDELTRELGVEREDYDMLFIDAQGAEVAILLGATATLQHVDFIWVEVGIGGIYAGDTPVADFAVLMKTLGFELSHCQLKRFGWGDALFARRSLFVQQA